MSAISYEANRLHFKADFIEPLAMHEEFEIVTPNATWLMSKANFYREFPKVIQSKSYRGLSPSNNRREYHYPNPPRRILHKEYLGR